MRTLANPVDDGHCRWSAVESGPSRTVKGTLVAARVAAPCIVSDRSLRIEDGELLESALPEVAPVVKTVARQQGHDAATLGWSHRDLQQHVTVVKRLDINRQGCLVVAELRKGPHD